ncbi:glycosyltransferase family 10 domain-containing protein [Halobacteriovorax marinus]|uniref:glycosyltransferase family 10 domain-containing protein n=1 Tax=Halobacteriovorax marinus TaxID=97084 RepID=UPI003A934FAA
MKKISFVVNRLYHKNILFDRSQSRLHIRDNVFHRYYELYDLLISAGYDVATNDINDEESSDLVVFLDMPKNHLSENIYKKSYLFVFEPPHVESGNFKNSRRELFRKVFTLYDEMINDQKYVKIFSAFEIPSDIPHSFEGKKLCCMIAANKSSLHPDELYSERKKAVRWFEGNRFEEFDLYGVGWNEFYFSGSRVIRALNKVPFARKVMFKLFGEYFPSYRGPVHSKFDVLIDYRFSICYENIKNVSGYITEKILDSFFAGCVPIYYGASNITEYIPKNTFIDMRDFQSYEDLYDFISVMSGEEYSSYLKNIKAFLSSTDSEKFSSSYFARTVFEEIQKDFQC